MSTVNKNVARLRRAKRGRKKVEELHLRDPNLVRINIVKSNTHIGAQFIKMDPLTGKSVVLACVSTQQEAIKAQCKYTGNIAAAIIVGKTLAEKAIALNVTKIAFDRAGHKYHGRVKALADAAREGGLNF
ncbi:MAG: 50S ribosomal protein L18 [Gammaproteobacteria bacterium]|nr:50S ribosomal protein L18 [Gammaproteobacteria bacterium]